MAFDKAGNLLVATGEDAFIYSVTPAGKSAILFDAEENHVRTLLVTEDILYAGTSGNGFVYRFDANDDPFVIFDPQMEEVNQLVLGNDGYLYASAFGQAMAAPTPRPSQNQQQKNNTNGTSNSTSDDAALSSQAINLESVVRSSGAPTSLFRISPDGYAKDLWLGSDEKIQSIFVHGDDILVGSGKTGKILSVNNDGDLSIILENGETHVTSFLKNKKEHIIFTTSNLGRVYQIENTRADTATFISETIDAGLVAQWGTLTVKSNKAAGSSKFYTRSGNTEQPSQTWSEWAPVEKDGEIFRIKSPHARFAQWKCELDNQNAEIDRVTLGYIQKNLAPTISSIIIHRPNDFYEVKSNSKNQKGIIFPATLPNKQTRKGFRTVDWLFEDPNFDALSFDLSYRRIGSALWRKMATDLEVNVHAWDSAQMADGEYEIKVRASDKHSNPENQTLTGERVSRSFIIDNSGPIINTGNKKQANVLTVRINDERTLLGKVQISIDASEWSDIYPLDGIIDSKDETFEIELPDAESHDIAIKASDKINNTSVVHTFVK